MTETVLKTVVKAAGDDPFEYVLSDATVDRYGDVIEASGWQLAQFKKNPVALFNHDNDFPIGRWEAIRVVGDRLVGKLVLAAEGTSRRIDEIRSLVEQGILKAVSVGFKPLEHKPNGDKGVRFTKQELLETSLVSVPANPNALQIAKSMNLSAGTMALVFGKSADDDQSKNWRPNGKSADLQTTRKSTQMSTPLSQRIEDTQAKLAAYRAELEKHLEEIGEEPDDEFNTITEELNGKIKSTETTLANLQESEKRLATVAASRSEDDPAVVNKAADPRKPFAAPAKKVEPVDYLMRAVAVGYMSHVTKQDRLTVLRQMYGEDVTTKAVTDIVLRAATVPADTVTPAWAGNLVQTAIGDFFDLLMPQSVYPGLAAKGMRVSLGRNGTISVPTRDATPTVAGAFVAQGAPIPVKQAAFSTVPLSLKKMGVITTMTREIMEHSTPAIEGILRNAIQEDTAIAIDTVLLDANAATSVRPAGIRNGAATAAGTAGGGFAAVVADLKAMVGALITASNGNIRSPVWIMNPVQTLALAVTQNSGGDFPFETEINQGRFQGYPVIQSTTVPAGTVIFLDAADFMTVTGDDPRFDVSDQAVLHMEDTTPLAIGTTGAPNTVAAPVRSLWQTDTIGIRMLLDLNWAFRRTGMVVVRTAVTW